MEFSGNACSRARLRDACVLGMLVGAAFAHNFSLASSADAGPGINGKIALVISIAVLLLIGIVVTLRERRKA